MKPTCDWPRSEGGFARTMVTSLSGDLWSGSYQRQQYSNRWQIGLLVIVLESDLSVCGGSGIASGSDSESHLIHHY